MRATDRSGSGSLQLVGVHRLDGGTPVRLVVDPVQHVLVRVLTPRPHTAPETNQTLPSVLARYEFGTNWYNILQPRQTTGEFALYEQFLTRPLRLINKILSRGITTCHNAGRRQGGRCVI